MSSDEESPTQAIIDIWPASFRAKTGILKNPKDNNQDEFLSQELSLGKLDLFLDHLWAVGGRHPAAPLNRQISSGREVILSERMDLHLVWDYNGKIFIKPLPRFLLDPSVWTEYLECRTNCECELSPPQGAKECDRKAERKCALGFLYTYVCLIAYESDLAIANEKRLLPRLGKDSEIQWNEWKEFSSEVLSRHDRSQVHPRFQRGELRLSRLNFFSRYTQWPLFTSYIRGWRNYRSLLRDNVTSLATASVFIGLILTAMQVALATSQLQENPRFMAVSVGFSIFSIVAPLAVVLLLVLEVFYNLLKDSLQYSRTRFKQHSSSPPLADAATVQEAV